MESVKIPTLSPRIAPLTPFEVVQPEPKATRKWRAADCPVLNDHRSMLRLDLKRLEYRRDFNALKLSELQLEQDRLTAQILTIRDNLAAINSTVEEEQ